MTFVFRFSGWYGKIFKKMHDNDSFLRRSHVINGASFLYIYRISFHSGPFIECYIIAIADHSGIRQVRIFATNNIIFRAPSSPDDSIVSTIKMILLKFIGVGLDF